MKRAFCILLVCLMAPALMAAQGKGKKVGQSRGIAEAVEDLEQQGRAAALKGDSSFAAQHLADDYMSVSAITGKPGTKADAIDVLKSGKLKYTAINVSETKVRVYGNTAIASGKADVKATMNGKDVSGSYWYTRTYVKQGNDWKVVCFQSTKAM